MAYLEIVEKFELNDKDILLEDAIFYIAQRITKYYSGSALTIQPDGITIDGNLNDFFERAFTKVKINITKKDGILFCSANGTLSIGFWAWVWFVLGLFTGFFFIWFLFDLITYLISRDRPKKYIQSAFEAIKVEYGK